MDCQEEQFLETKALLRALERDDAALLCVIEQLLPNERRGLHTACAFVSNAINRVNDREYAEQERNKSL